MNPGTVSVRGEGAKKGTWSENSIWRVGRVGSFVWATKAVGDGDSKGLLKQKRSSHGSSTQSLFYVVALTNCSSVPASICFFITNKKNHARKCTAL